MAIKYPNPSPILQAAGFAWSKKALSIVVREVERNLSGKVLNKRTGALLRSIRRNSRATAQGFNVATNLLYGRAWEMGFTRPKYTIPAVPFPQGLRRVVFERKRFPARRWLRPAGMSKLPELRATFAQTVGKAFKRSFPDQIIVMSLDFK